MKRIAIITTLVLMSSMAKAQSCNTLCNENWWKSTTQTEFETMLLTADVNERGKNGITTLFWASYFGTPENVDALIAAGAAINALEIGGMTPQFWAALSGMPNSVDNVEVLVAAGANVNARDLSQMTPLFWAEFPKIVVTLLAGGANVDAQIYDGQTALFGLED